MKVLLDRSTPVAERELAAEVARNADEGPIREVSREEAHISLRHVDLPKLADAGLITWDQTDATVTAAARPALDDTRFERAIESTIDQGDGVVGDVMNQHRRTILTLLESRNGPWERADLAREIAAREATGDPSTETTEEVLIRLHHVDLPKLEQAGLVEYDADDGAISYLDSRNRQ